MVSSVVTGFEGFRKAAGAGIDSAGGEPLLVNEDFPALAVSSRNACLDAVASSDYLLVIIGERGGWTTPSGKLVVEEEFEEARRRKLPVIVFVQEGVTRDENAQRFERRLSDYVTGNFRQSFRSADDLRRLVETSLIAQFTTPMRRPMAKPHGDHFTKPHQIQGTAMLRFVLTPERAEEVLDPVRLTSKEFQRRVMELGHTGDASLFSYEGAKRTTTAGDALVIEETPPDVRHGEGRFVRLQLLESGDVVIDANVTGRRLRGSRQDLFGSMFVAVEDIEEVLRECFAFSNALYDEVDRFQRHQTFTCNAALSGLDYRTLERNPQPRHSYPMSMRNSSNVIVAHDTARRVSRQDLRTPSVEIERTILRLEQKAAG